MAVASTPTGGSRRNSLEPRPEGLDAEIDAHTGDGGIVLDKPVTVTGTIRENTVRGRLGAGGLPLRIHTGDGSIRLRGL